MSLSAGSRLGPYEILAPIGAGGMGEVYRARDTRLGREVAIKVLPDRIAQDPDALARFEREAKTISALSHPHICALYDVGNQDGVEYLVMEYLEGQTLAQRLTKGPLPLDQTLRYGMEIAEALDRAHRQGIVHRDLKPGNVMLTGSGVKLLDFGLAKLIARPSPIGLTGLSMLPTTPQERELTGKGTILGTFQYMAPEQLEGNEADSRTDIFALGAALYEMATGQKAFAGASQASLIGAILRDEPKPITSVSPLTPPALDRIVETCLAKDPEERWQSAHDVRTELLWVAEGRSQDEAKSPVRRPNRERIAWATAIAAVLAAVSLAVIPHLLRKPIELRVQRLQVLPPEGTSFALEEAPRISPDGEHLAFVASDSAGKSLLYVRRLDSLTSQALADTDGASMPFWSPDGRSLGFFAGGKLKTIGIAEGRPRILADAPVGRGGAWSRGGVIVFVPSPPEPPYVVPASGGAAKPLLSLGPIPGVPRRFFPDFLPDGRHYVYTAVSRDREKRAVCVTSLDTNTEKQLVSSTWSAVFAPPGYLLFRRETTLMAQRFDPQRLALTGEPFVVASDVGFNPITWQALFSASGNGILAFHGVAGAKTKLTWLDREGKELGVVGPPGIFNSASLSPDDKRVAYDQADPKTGDIAIWLSGSERSVPSRFTFGPAVNFFPVWSWDGSRVIFSTLREGPPQIYQKVTTGTGDEEPLYRSDQAKIPTGVSSDGRFLVYAVLHPKTQFDLWVLPLFGDRRPFPFLQTPAAEIGGQISPNGRWMAYASNEAGTYEVYVRPFPPGPGKWQVSREGGAQPRWRRDGKELFYLSTDRRLMAVEVNTELPAFESGVARALFVTHVSNIEGSNPWGQYAVSADGRRFLVNRLATDTASSPITVILNWPAAEKK